MATGVQRSTRGVLLQAFEWYLPDDCQHWNRLKERAKEFSETGVTAVWIPPPYKGASGVKSVGYDVYDLHDLGEFNQKGTVPTKYGTRDELKGAVNALQAEGVHVYVDTVLNHRMGADQAERVRAVPYDASDRSKPAGPVMEITTWTKFNYQARNGKYSQFEWRSDSFDTVDYDHSNPDRKNTIYLFEGKEFDESVSKEHGGNYDHLLGCDVDFHNMYVVDELRRWGEWIIDPTTLGGCQGFRLDALKHIPASFWPNFLDTMRKRASQFVSEPIEFFVVGELVEYSVPKLNDFLKAVQEKMSLFDFPLLSKFHRYSKDGNGSDMSKIFDGTLVHAQPDKAVTFITNHDTVPGQALAQHVADWFKPLAYALILLRPQGYPCVFWADIYGSDYVGEHGHHHTLPPFKEILYKLMKTRQYATFGTQRDYFDNFHIIGWTFDGSGHPANKACAVIMSGGAGGSKWMEIGVSGKVFTDILGNQSGEVTSNNDGYGEFRCGGGSVSVWMEI